MSECLTKSAEREHYGLAVSCARRFFGRGVPPDELIGEAEAALLWAATRFDKSRGVRFSTYAIPFVLGALKELCRKSAPMRVPRNELRLLSASVKLREKWLLRDGREPTLLEISRAVGLPADKLAAMLLAKERMASLTSDPEVLAMAVDGSAGFEERVLVRDAVRRLGRPYAQVVWLRFFAGYSQEDIAKKYGVSQGQVSRWEKRGKELLREGLA